VDAKPTEKLCLCCGKSFQLCKPIYEMLPAEVGQAVREYEADNGNDDGGSAVVRNPAPALKFGTTGDHRFGRLRRTYLLDLRCERRLERILPSANAVKAGHRGRHEQQRRKRENRAFPKRDVLRSMTRQKSIEQARGT